MLVPTAGRITASGFERGPGARDRPPRALLAGTAVLVLDQPTAHFDPRAASERIEDVFSAAGNQTVWLITHRSEGLDRVKRVVSMAGMK